VFNVPSVPAASQAAVDDKRTAGVEAVAAVSTRRRPHDTMSFVVAILSAIVGGGIFALGIVLVRFNRKWLRIARVAAAATKDDLESIYRQIDETSRENPAGWVLGRNARTSVASAFTRERARTKREKREKRGIRPAMLSCAGPGKKGIARAGSFPTRPAPSYLP
jgi:hypothetical protein